MRQVAIPREVYTGTSNQLFDYLAKALVEFIKEQEQVMSIAVQQLLLRCQSHVHPPIGGFLACMVNKTPRLSASTWGVGPDKQGLCYSVVAVVSTKAMSYSLALH